MSFDSFGLGLLIFIFALIVDITFGEPPNRLHPTFWMGRLTAFLEPRLRRGRTSIQRANGILLVVAVIGAFCISYYILLEFLKMVNLAAYVVASIILLKTTLAMKSMNQHTIPIASAIRRKDLSEARTRLSRVVRRETRNLDEQSVLSATVETIAEGAVDGAAGPLFFYGLFGPLGSAAYRAANTLDSMVGYRDEHEHTGWFSAKLDSYFNYVPARLIGIITSGSAMLLHLDWKGAGRILMRDARKTESINAGFSMAAMAGAMNVALEKQGFYRLGDSGRLLGPEDVMVALRIMKLNILLFTLLIVIPMLALTHIVLM